MIKISDSNFEELVLKADKPVMVDFWAEWCGPCRMVSPIMEQLSDEYDTVIVGKVNVDENPEVSRKYSIMSIPTVLFFKEGQIVDKQIGATQKAAYVRKIQELL